MVAEVFDSIVVVSIVFEREIFPISLSHTNTKCAYCRCQFGILSFETPLGTFYKS